MTISELLEQPGTAIRVGLVIQGGGMRGSYSAGACAYLASTKHADSISYAIGTSAGGINATYFAARHTSFYEAYTEFLSNNRFITVKDKKPYMDLDYLVDIILKKAVKLDMRKLRASATKVEISVTNIFTQEVEYRDPCKEKDVYELFRATSAMPIFYGKSVLLDDTPYIDGGVKDSVPISRASSKNCTHIIVILCKEPDEEKESSTRMVKFALRRLHPDWPEELWSTMGSEGDSVYDTLRNIPANKYGVPKLLVLKPSDPTKLVSRFTRSHKDLKACAEMGRQDMQRFLKSTL